MNFARRKLSALPEGRASGTLCLFYTFLHLSGHYTLDWSAVSENRLGILFKLWWGDLGHCSACSLVLEEQTKKKEKQKKKIWCLINKQAESITGHKSAPVWVYCWAISKRCVLVRDAQGNCLIAWLLRLISHPTVSGREFVWSKFSHLSQTA